ncbi:MAG: 4-phosphoerythronate dehydrogenase [Calditrichaeota bacterium]|nr:MAG: 4-phosphoerythronate dehydrogenase [Calditrichota bacterium]
MMLKIAIDENISHAAEAFGELGEIQLVSAHEITPATLQKTDALIVRSTVRIDEKLLCNSPVKFVGTATIGTDHVDETYLNEAGIAFASAAGCNANAVAEYVFTALSHLAVKRGMQLSECTLGVVGVGHVGSRVVRLAKACGLRVLQNDPPLARQSENHDFVELEELMQADIVTLHVPLTMDGGDKTWHLFEANQLEKLSEDVVLINAARGAVIDNQALLAWKKENTNAALILDVWEDEPDIALDLLSTTEIATPHIAGYSMEGKANGTAIIYQEFCRHFDIQANWQPRLPALNSGTIVVRGDAGIESALAQSCGATYNLLQDDAALRKIEMENPDQRADYFHALRKNYALRREFFNYHLRLEPMDINLALMLNAFRFQVEN